MKKTVIMQILAVMMLLLAAVVFTACSDDGGGYDGDDEIPEDTVINISTIAGVTPPIYGEAPVTEIAETAQYTGTVSWSPSHSTFEATTVYTATITLTVKTGYSLTEVTEDFFTVAGAETVSNFTDSGMVTAVFPETGEDPFSVIPGVRAPVLGAIPVTAIIETEQYTGTVTWDGGWAWSRRFGGNKAYTATITLTARPGHTLTGVTEDFFTVPGATSVTNSADSGVITAVFPPTAKVSVGDAILGGKVAYILVPGDPGYVSGEQRGLIAATADQDGGAKVVWAESGSQFTPIPGGTGTALGTGSDNTDNIVARNGAGRLYAAGLARAYHGGGYNDWYLPSRDELDKLYMNKDAIGGFTWEFYWSSSELEYHDSYAWYQLFYNGVQDYNQKYIEFKVRAVRSF